MSLFLMLSVILLFLITACSGSPQAAIPDQPTQPTVEIRITSTAEDSSAPVISASPTPPVEAVKDEPAAEAPKATPSEVVSPSATPVITITTTTPLTNNQSASVPASPQDCINQAVFVGDVTIPDGTLFNEGEEFVKTWRIKNSGTCNWESYDLVYASGDIMNSSFQNPLQTIMPGEIADISLTLHAPSRFGEHTGYWEFQTNTGQRFGTGVPSIYPLWVQISVRSSQPASASAPAVSSNATPSNPIAPGTSNSGTCSPPANESAAQEILGLVNSAREQNGLSPLELNSELSAAALVHSRDMACNRFVDHDGTDGSNWNDRAAAQGYSNPNSVRENIYVGDPAFGGTAQGTFNWWMNSQVHRDNILYPDVNQIGIAYVYLPGSPYGGYYTLLVGR